MTAATPSAERMRAVLGSVVFLFLAPGTIAGIFPWVITRWRAQPVAGGEFLRLAGLLLIAAGLAVLVEAFLRFALLGRGTPAPNFPTDRLIVTGTYRFVRNPMYLAVEALILGQALFFAATDLIIYGAIIAVGFHLFVVLVEEPTLRRSFPKGWRRYAENVHRWRPRLLPWRPGQQA